MAELDTLGAVIKTTYEGEADTNAFTDEEQTKLGTALQNVAEDTTPQLGGNLDAQGSSIGGYIGNVVTGVSGALTAAAHSGNLLVTSGNVTVPTTPGFACVIEAGGAHTVTFNGTTSAAMAEGDVMNILVTSGTTIRAGLIEVADQVGFS